MRDSQKPKYVNSPETAIYRKGRSLFGLDLARQHATREGRVIVVEGYTDVIALHQGGIQNVVASMGTALTDEQVAELARLAGVLLLAFDADRSGRDAMLRVQSAAAGRGLNLKVVRLPDDKDPCDLLLEEGPDNFATRAGEAISFLQFQVESVMEGADTASATEKDRLVAELAPIFADVEPSAERDEQLRLVADRLDLSEHLLAPLLAPPRAGRRPSSAAPSGAGAAARGERWERIFLAMCVSSGEQGRTYLERLSEDHLSSRLLERARLWILENFDAPTAGLSAQDDQLAQVVSEIVVRASKEPESDAALEVGFLGLERRRLEARDPCGGRRRGLRAPPRAVRRAEPRYRDDRPADERGAGTGKGTLMSPPDPAYRFDEPAVEPAREPDSPSTDSVRTYLKEIGGVSLLSAKDEVRLAS